MRRWGTGDDFGGIAVYIMSSASRYHTGDTFLIDGAHLREPQALLRLETALYDQLRLP